MKITILGCGASSGSPLIGEPMPSNPKNIRTRASIYIEGARTRLLIDTSPDFRQQALAAQIKDVDAVLYTHSHADHIHGIDDLKSFAYRKRAPVNIYGNRQTLDELKERFAYCFDATPSQSGWIRPYLRGGEIAPGKPFMLGEFHITPFTQAHTKNMDSLGFRINDFVYSTDVKEFPPESEQYLQNMKLWVVDCLKSEQSHTHSDLGQTLGWIEEYKPQQAVLTHLSHLMDYDVLARNLPVNIEAAFDGMVLEV